LPSPSSIPFALAIAIADALKRIGGPYIPRDSVQVGEGSGVLQMMPLLVLVEGMTWGIISPSKKLVGVGVAVGVGAVTPKLPETSNVDSLFIKKI
jgi:hypothetical protein